MKSLQRAFSPKYRGKKSKRRSEGGSNVSSCQSQVSTDADISNTMGSTSQEKTASGVLNTVVTTSPPCAQDQGGAVECTVVPSPIPTLDESDMESMSSSSPSSLSLRRNERFDKINDLRRRLQYAEERAETCLTENAVRNRTLLEENEYLRQRLTTPRPIENLPSKLNKHFPFFGFICVVIWPVISYMLLATFLKINPKGLDPNSAGQICRMTAASRALAHKDINSFYSEPLAELLAGEEMMNLISETSALSKQSAATAGKKDMVNGVVARTMVVDKTLEVYTNGVHAPKQVVILGAGMDTRVHRLRLPGVTYYEIDQADVIDMKVHLLNAAGVSEEDVSVKRVRLDLSGSELEMLYEKLAEVGFESSNPAIYVMEGLLCYLTVDEAKRLLIALKGTSKSRIISSVVDANHRTNLPIEMVENLMRSDLKELKRAGAFRLYNWRITRTQSLSRRLKALNVGASLMQSSKGHEMIVELESK